MIAQFKDAGIIVIPTVGAARDAEKVAGWGADAVIVQGSEGGGHTGSVPTSLLLPSVVRAVVTDAGALATGQVFGMIDDLPSVRELIERIVFDAESRLDELQQAR